MRPAQPMPPERRPRGKRAEDPSTYTKEELAKELVDIIFNTLKIANHYEINLDDYWSKRLEGIKAKFDK